MRIIAVSDSHGNLGALQRVFERTESTGSIFVHLGDGEQELEMIKRFYPRLDIRSVAGNCDHGSLSQDFDVIRVKDDVKVLITHGHKYDLRDGTKKLIEAAHLYGCKAVLFGHTHCRYQGYEDGVYLLNPGSCSSPRDFSKPSFGYIDITPYGIVTNIVDL